ncbi:hypothetical protein Poly51_21910 [Rubripirellula tenax]|uniref:Uncharacterized protein n=1 Tax=Rubripirellula tenax TaxID=2528015 RepID=A0A5C6FCG2_9BACT|nr:hypothetical protein [Rubripirellula tenax]TWU59403.1 hypothetical protein Poly51_21910 [Rubripirellula tenax]
MNSVNPFQTPGEAPQPPTHSTNPNTPTSLLAILRTSQLICGALVVGLSVIVVTFAIMRRPPDAANDPTIFLVVGGGMGLLTIVMSMLLPVLIPKPPIERSAALAEVVESAKPGDRLPAEMQPVIANFMTRQLLVAAPLEGGAVTNVVLWFVGGSHLHVVFVGIAIALMVLRMPTMGRLRDHLADAVT